MLTLLIATDGSEYSDRAVDYAIRRAGQVTGPVKAHVLNVQAPLQGVNVKIFISKSSLEEYYRDEGMAIVQPACQRLEAAGIGCEPHVGVGDPGQVAVEFARDKGCDEIVMGTHGRGVISGAMMGSVAQKVAHLSNVPVVLVK